MYHEKLVLLHLSDIHFKYDKEGEIFDFDDDVRNEIEISAATQSKSFGGTDAVLITGDIAFSGKTNEYDVAKSWIDSLTNQIGCERSNVWLVPGNHDVEWDVIKQSKSLKVFRSEIRKLDTEYIDSELKEYLKDSEFKNIIFNPIKNYNQFASRFNCNMDARNIFWKQDFELNDKSTLRVIGLNSTIVSDRNDNTAKNKLILSSFQTQFKSEDDVEYLSLCHHPPQWLKDEDEVEDRLLARTKIQFFGHKHRQRIIRINNSLRLSAGAVHPYRTKDDWEPRFNFVLVCVKQKKKKRYLEITVYPKVWNDVEKCFNPEYKNGDECQTFRLHIRTIKQKLSSEVSSERVTGSDNKEEKDINMNKIIFNINSEISNPKRFLLYKYLDLPYPTIIKIAQNLELISHEDQRMDYYELYQEYFYRAEENDKLSSLWDEVYKLCEDSLMKNNPFRK